MDEQPWSLLNQDITKPFAILTTLRINDELYAVNTIFEKIRDGLYPLGDNQICSERMFAGDEETTTRPCLKLLSRPQRYARKKTGIPKLQRHRKALCVENSS
jgi:hypothetical protein